MGVRTVVVRRGQLTSLALLFVSAAVALVRQIQAEAMCLQQQFATSTAHAASTGGAV
jgi:hypothetical protein